MSSERSPIRARTAWKLMVASGVAASVAWAQTPTRPETPPADDRPSETTSPRDGREELPAPVESDATSTPLPPRVVNPPRTETGAAPATPGNASRAPGERAPETPLGTSSDMVELAAFAAPVELSVLVDMLAKQLEVNIAVKGSIAGSVTFNAPIAVPKDRFLALVRALLEQQGYTITRDRETGFYLVHAINEVDVSIGGDAPSTRVIPTPNVRPSALKPAIDAQFGGASGGGGGMMPGANPGQPGASGVSTGGAIASAAYIDELGVIVVTASARRLDAVESLVNLLLEEYGRAKFIRLELRFVSAPVARERALQLIGQAPQQARTFNPNMGGDPSQAMQAQTRLATLDNLADRLTVDPSGNALIFRGLPVEVDRVREVLDTIDVPSGLVARKHEVGLAARQIADLAKQRGLGEVTTITTSAERRGNQFGGQFFGEFDPNQRNQQRATTAGAGGSIMVVDEDRGTIIYYGTEEQQKLLDDLIKGIDLESDVIVVREYKLRFASAEKVAEIINGLLTNRTPAAQSSLLPGASGSSRNQRNQPATPAATPNPVNISLGPDFSGARGAGGDQGVGFTGGENVFVLADASNNQVLVKAPARQQREFAQLIERIDLRRPQVHITAQIVAVTAGDDFRLAFETQLINASGSGGVLNTNFGLSSFPANAGIDTAKTVNSGLGGLTAAVIKSQYVPFVINTLATTTDTRILAQPSVMVNDNEEATIERIDEQPTTQSNQGTSTTTTSFAGYEKAGTNLKITPRISGNLVTLAVESELSAFEGTGSGGIPPPRNTANIVNKAVTVPSDMTVVIGGITLNARTDSVRKVPVLGDIPLVGYLFRDTNKTERRTVLYIFITPRIVTDPSFEDLRLLTTGPQSQMEMEKDLPPLRPVLVDFFVPGVEAKGGERPSLTGPELKPQPVPGFEPIKSSDPLPPPLPLGNPLMPKK